VSDFFSRLERQLVAAAERRARRRLIPRVRWTRRTALVLIPAVVLVAVPAFAAVSGVFQSNKRLVNLNPKPCVDKRPLRPRMSNQPPPADLVSMLGVLRRPTRPSDRVNNSLALLPFVAGINRDSVRVRRQSPKTTLVVYTAENIHAMPDVPNTPACRAVNGPTHPAQPGVCLVTRYGAGGGAGCYTAREIQNGTSPGSLSGGGLPDGSALVSGLVPDGVTSVSLTFSQRGHVRDVRLPVVENVYAGLVQYKHVGLRPRVVWNGPTGSRLAAKGGSPLTARQRRLARRSLKRDLAATAVPKVFPPVGNAKTLFTLRVRPPKPASRRAIYVVRLIGLSTAGCRQRGRRDLPAYAISSGRRKGLLAVAFGPSEMGGGTHWCRITYHGLIQIWPHGIQRNANRHVYARFTFRVR
jgi:hypothetical protein